MNYDLKEPCPQCPFRNDITAYLTSRRAEEISDSLRCGASFPCHKTTVHDDDGEVVVASSEQFCAGALIMLEHMEEPNQIMRIAERLGFYDPAILKMDSHVFTDDFEFADAQEADQ